MLLCNHTALGVFRAYALPVLLLVKYSKRKHYSVY
jgi:hypothetical protein